MRWVLMEGFGRRDRDGDELGFGFAAYGKKYIIQPPFFLLLFVNGTVNYIRLTEPYYTVRFD